jgi:hypothetical protein
MDVSSTSNNSLNAEQIATLANFEFALSNAVHKVLLPSGSPGGGAQSKLKTRGVVADLTTGVPVIGVFLRPMASLLEALNLDSANFKPGSSAFSLALLNEEQSMKLAQFQTILRQEVKTVFPDFDDSASPDPPSPSEASPNDVKPSPTPEPSSNTPEDDGSDSGTSSPDDASPADVPASTPISSPAPK